MSLTCPLERVLIPSSHSSYHCRHNSQSREWIVCPFRSLPEAVSTFFVTCNALLSNTYPSCQTIETYSHSQSWYLLVEKTSCLFLPKQPVLHSTVHSVSGKENSCWQDLQERFLWRRSPTIKGFAISSSPKQPKWLQSYRVSVKTRDERRKDRRREEVFSFTGSRR